MSFTEKLGNNQRDFAEAALLRTICEDPSQTVGEIWDSLESDAETGLMFDIFKKMSIGRLVTAASRFATGEEEAPEERPAASASEKKVKKKPRAQPSTEVEDDEDDDDFDDDEFEDDGEFIDGDEDDEDDEDEDDEDDSPEPKPKKVKKGKKPKGKKSKGKKSKDKKSKSSKKDKDDGHLPGLSSPDGKKKYQSSIVKYLKSVKAYDEEGGKRSTECREAVGGSAKQFRENIGEMFEAERVLAHGQARGMRYFLPKKNK